MKKRKALEEYKKIMEKSLPKPDEEAWTWAWALSGKKEGRRRRRKNWIDRKKQVKKTEKMATKNRGKIEKERMKTEEKDLGKRREAKRTLKIEELKSEKV